MEPSLDGHDAYLQCEHCQIRGENGSVCCVRVCLSEHKQYLTYIRGEPPTAEVVVEEMIQDARVTGGNEDRVTAHMEKCYQRISPSISSSMTQIRKKEAEGDATVEKTAQKRIQAANNDRTTMVIRECDWDIRRDQDIRGDRQNQRHQRKHLFPFEFAVREREQQEVIHNCVNRRESSTNPSDR
jgi:alpha-glucosidase (family GH31 glycosyl hydrolase)